MTSIQYKAVCQHCGKSGNWGFGSLTGEAPNMTPVVLGTCPCHPSGKPNMPHSPRWEKA